MMQICGDGVQIDASELITFISAKDVHAYAVVVGSILAPRVRDVLDLAR
jgi:hypothetical protein